MPDADHQCAVTVFKKILTALEKEQEISGHKLCVAASLGIALFPENGAEECILMQLADVAMYSAKRSKSGFAFYGDASVKTESTPGTQPLFA